MKKLQQIGKILSKQELKGISGGQHGGMFYCTCMGVNGGVIFSACAESSGGCMTPSGCVSEPVCTYAPPAFE